MNFAYNMTTVVGFSSPSAKYAPVELCENTPPPIGGGPSVQPSSNISETKGRSSVIGRQLSANNLFET